MYDKRFSFLFLQLPKLFPNMLMVLQVFASDSPVVSLQPGLGELGLQVGVIASAIELNATQVPLFKLSSVSSNTLSCIFAFVFPSNLTWISFFQISKFSGKMWIADQKLKGSVTMDK